MSALPPVDTLHDDRERVHVTVGGAVQGVGFRPFVYRLAHQEHLGGWVCNTPDGVELEAEGEAAAVNSFLHQLCDAPPEHSRIERYQVTRVGLLAETEFRILESRGTGTSSVVVQPDLATCQQCLAEIGHPGERRYRYPFTNCTHCGPRYSIITSLPYDRAHTTMREFRMCKHCATEYQDPLDRRFHAQPIACPECGPQLEFRDHAGSGRSRGDVALWEAAEALRDGKIVAMKGVGGFHLMTDARNEQAVARLRVRKHRHEKPFALMVQNMEQASGLAHVSDAESNLLRSAAGPIVLLRARETNSIAQSVAPRNPLLGIMLPSNPLHHLLLQDVDFPLVATSGNLSDEPICTDEAEAYERLHRIADCFLVHNRPIARPLDDSIVRVVAGEPMVLRIGRGYAPLHLPMDHVTPGILAVGAHQKCTVALSLTDSIVLSQHLGDLDNVLSICDHRACTESLAELYAVKIQTTTSDMHPDYVSSRMAESLALPNLQVQHHHAHALACASENQIELPALAVTWDGTGLGTDKTVWGGEFLRIDQGGFQRIAHLRQFPLPGGDAAVRDPRRSLFGLLHEYSGSELASSLLQTSGCIQNPHIQTLRNMLRAGLNCPRTSSIGRLFDAIAMLLGLRCRCSFEGQAAMDLEFAAMGCTAVPEPYVIDLVAQSDGTHVLDWSPMLTEMLEDIGKASDTSVIAARFHEGLAASIVQMARIAGEPRVILTGGCFQNAYLLERAIALLRASGFEPVWHHRVPPNDNSIALGQLTAAAHSGNCQFSVNPEDN